jgi:hypothetical protein
MGAIASPLVTGLGTLGSIAGAVLPVVTSANQIVSQFQNLSGSSNGYDQLAREQDLALRQLQQRQNMDYQQSQAQAALERERLAAETSAGENARRDALRRAVARQRAQFGASGIGSAGGSSEAVLFGLFEESDEQREERERLDSLRTRALDLSLANQNSLNILQRSQLAARQKLDREASKNNRSFF